MSKLLFNSLREVKNRLNELNNRLNAFRFGLKVMSEKRKKYYINLVMLSATALTTGLYLSYNTLFINQYKSVVHMYSSGDLMPINANLEKLAKNVWIECNQSVQKSSHLISFFPSVGSEPISIGSLGVLTGALVGLPHNLTYDTTEDVKTIDMRFEGEHNPHMKWRSEAGQAFIEALVLSERAKKFAIARHIYLANNLNLLIDCLNVCISMGVAIGLAQVVISRTKIFKTFGHRLIVRVLALFVGLYIWAEINRINKYYSTLRADKRAVSLGDDYLEGAIEYYSKLKIRQAAFYELVEDRGHRLYTEDGELKGLTSRHLLTISRRINYLNDLKNQKQNTNAVNEEIETK